MFSPLGPPDCPAFTHMGSKSCMPAPPAAWGSPAHYTSHAWGETRPPPCPLPDTLSFLSCMMVVFLRCLVLCRL